MSAKLKGYLTIKLDKELRIPLFVTAVQAGIPERIDDPTIDEMSLIEYLVKHPATTFAVPVRGDSMIDAGIKPGDILMADSALEAHRNDIVIAAVDGECTVKRLQEVRGHIRLISDSKKYTGPPVIRGQDLNVLGVVTFRITAMR